MCQGELRSKKTWRPLWQKSGCQFPPWQEVSPTNVTRTPNSAAGSAEVLREDPSTRGTPSLLSCILQISALSVVPHPFASHVESVPYNSKFNGVLGYRNPFEPTHRVRSIRWELTWGGQKNRSSREGLGQILSYFKICCAVLSRVWLLAILWNVAHQAPLSMGFFPGKNTGVGCHFLL